MNNGLRGEYANRRLLEPFNDGVPAGNPAAAHPILNSSFGCTNP
jgi:hypothetical protein